MFLKYLWPKRQDYTPVMVEISMDVRDSKRNKAVLLTETVDSRDVLHAVSKMMTSGRLEHMLGSNFYDCTFNLSFKKKEDQ